MAEHPGGDGNPMNSLAYKLERLATRLKKEGNLEGAIVALRRANDSGGDVGTRLAKYLQQAGRIDEALTEIQRLLDGSDARAKALFSHQPTSVILRQKTGYRARIHKDAALICKRARRFDMQAHHEGKYESLMELVWKIDDVADADQAARRSAWDEARAKGGAAFRAFLQSRLR